MTGPKCTLCHRQLTAAESIALGVGPECATKQQAFLAACGTSVAEIGALVLSGDPTAQRMIARFTAAMASGNQGHAMMFLARARECAVGAQDQPQAA